MEFHPSKIPILKTYDIKDEKSASDAVEDMVKLGVSKRKEGFKVLMPKEKKQAKRIGYTITTSLSYSLSKNGQDRNVRYWTYHEDKDHYAIVLISVQGFDQLDLWLLKDSI